MYQALSSVTVDDCLAAWNENGCDFFAIYLQAFDKAVRSTINKPKPKVEPPKEEEKKTEDAGEKNTNASNNESQATEETPKSADMEVD